MKIITFALACILAFAVLAIAGCETARGAPKSEKAAVSVTLDSVDASVLTDQAFAEAVLTRPIAAKPVAGIKLCTVPAREDLPQTDEFGYFYLLDHGEWRPPSSFNGLGGDHFARADV